MSVLVFTVRTTSDSLNALLAVVLALVVDRCRDLRRRLAGEPFGQVRVRRGAVAGKVVLRALAHMASPNLSEVSLVIQAVGFASGSGLYIVSVPASGSGRADNLITDWPSRGSMSACRVADSLIDDHRGFEICILVERDRAMPFHFPP